MNDEDQYDSDSLDSILSEEDSAVSHPINICDFVVPAVEELSNLVNTFPNIPQEQQKVWARAVSRLVAKCTVPSYKFALLGKTGVGKSTLLNCLLGHSIIPSSAAGACTSAITEITYADLDEFSATIVFKSKPEWREELKILLDDINPGNDSSEGLKSKESLFTVYPQLRNKDVATLTPSQLLKMEPVKDRVGTSREVTASDPDNFRANLEEYLSSSTGNSNTAKLWPLVSRVEIRGPFPVLSTGIVLVDLPGHGDDDDTRNAFATEYIKTAAGVVLVTDVKRAQNDRDTLNYLRKTLSQIIMDGRSVEDFVVLAATGTDNLIGDNEIPLEGDDQAKLAQLTKELKELRQSVQPPKKLKTKTKDIKPKQRGKHDARLEGEIRELEKSKALLLANARVASVRRAIEDFFLKLSSDLAPAENEPARLPVFCVGSQDYLALKSFSRTPFVFFEEEQTEIPMLKKHLRATGERRRIGRWATHLLNDLEILSENIHSYFSEGRHPGRLQAENKLAALNLIKELEKANLQEAEAALAAIEEEVNRVKNDLKKATKKAAADSPQVMAGFGGLHWSTYRACMRLNGVYYAHDINRSLTRDILPAIQGSWNGGINHKIPRTIREATAMMEENTLTKITEIIKALNGQGTAFERPIDAARKSLGVEGYLSDMLAEAIQRISVAQRDGTRSFNTVIQQELTPQYQWSFQMSGPGSFARMKKSNASYLEEHGEVVFHSINTHIEKLLDDALAKIKHDFRANLHTLITTVRLSLVEDVNLSKDHKEVKDLIIQVTLDNRPAIATRKIDLADQQRSLNT